MASSMETAKALPLAPPDAISQVLVVQMVAQAGLLMHSHGTVHGLGLKPPIVSEVPPTATDVVIVRHGETTWNRDHRIQGQMDSDLNDAGVFQAQAVGARLGTGEIPFSAIYSSDLRRAAHTAEAIAQNCGKKVTAVSGLRERHAGAVQGLRPHEAKELQPEAYEAFLSRDPSTVIPGGGESLNQLRERVVSCVDDIAQNHKGERIVVVCHGVAITAMHKHATGKNPAGGVRNASINIVRIHEDGWWELMRWGDIDHLAGTEVSDVIFGGGLDSA